VGIPLDFMLYFTYSSHLVFGTSPAVVANFCAWDCRFSYSPAANIMAMGAPTTEKHSGNS